MVQYVHRFRAETRAAMSSIWACVMARYSFEKSNICGPDKYWFADEARIIANELQLPIYATRGTAEMLAEIGIPCTAVEKSTGTGVSGLDVIEQGQVDFVINVARHAIVCAPASLSELADRWSEALRRCPAPE